MILFKYAVVSYMISKKVWSRKVAFRPDLYQW